MGVRYLQDDEYLLRSQQIIGNDEIPKEQLEDLFQSKANKKFPIIPFAPYVWVHHMGETRYDSVKIEFKIEKIEAKYERKKLKHQENKNKVARIDRSKEEIKHHY